MTTSPDDRQLTKAAPEPPRPALFRLNPFQAGFLGGIGVLLALLVGSIVTSLATILVYVGLALFISLGLDPLVSWLEKKLPRGLAIGIVFAAVVGVFVLLLFSLIPILVEQTTNLVTNFPDIVKSFVNLGWVKHLQAQLNSVIDVNAAVQGVISFFSDPKNVFALGGGVLAVGGGVASGLTGFIIVLILTLYFLASMRAIKGGVVRFAPAYNRPRVTELTDNITKAVGRYVVGQVGLAAVNGILSFIFLSIIGAPIPLLLAFVAFLLSLVPLVGTLSGAIIITLVCLFASPLTAIVAGIYYLAYMQVEAYVLSPRIMNRAVSVPGALVVIAAAAGGTLGGVLGALVAIPVMASILIIVDQVVLPRQDAKIEKS